MKKKSQADAINVNKSARGYMVKQRGEAAEAAFLSKAASLGFQVAKPWGESSHFDFILYTGSHCWRVQVKSTQCSRHQYYSIMLKRGNRGYTEDDVDFIVVYLVPINAWYVFPIEVVSDKASLTFSPRPGSRSRSEPYREAWCLLACPRDGKCNPEISVSRHCVASESGECAYHAK